MSYTKKEELAMLNDCHALFKRSWKQAKEEEVIEELSLKQLCKGFFINGYLEARADKQDQEDEIRNSFK